MVKPADIYRLHHVPVPQREKVLVVDGLSADLPPAVWTTYLDKIAMHVAVAAMAHGVTRIIIKRPHGMGPVTLDLDEVVKDHATQMGYWPHGNFPMGAVLDLWRLGARFERTAPMVSVPAFPAESGAERGA